MHLGYHRRIIGKIFCDWHGHGFFQKGKRYQIECRQLKVKRLLETGKMDAISTLGQVVEAMRNDAMFLKWSVKISEYCMRNRAWKIGDGGWVRLKGDSGLVLIKRFPIIITIHQVDALNAGETSKNRKKSRYRRSAYGR